MARSRPLLTEVQWQKIAPLLPKPPQHRKGGRPWIENRRGLEGILWILRSGARWQDLPEKYPHPSTCWRRLRDWEEQGVWLNIWRTFLSELNEREQLDWSESFLDGSFASAKKGAAESGNQAGQGDEVDGGGRRRGCSSGRPPLFCIPGGSPARGDDARVDPRRPAASRGAPAPEAGAGDYRPSLRQRSVAYSFAASGDRTYLSAQEEPRSSSHSAWPSAAPIPKTLGSRTHDRLARQLPALGSTLRAFAQDLWCVFSHRLLHDRLTEGCAIASSKPLT